MKKFTLILLPLFLVSLNNFSQSPITYSVFISSLPTCSTCCDGVACITAPSGGACAGVYQIQWSNGQTTSCANNFCSASVYSVSVYDFPCGDTTTKTFSMPAYTSIREYENQVQLKVYPNPVSNILIISSDQIEFENPEIKIVNTSGQTVFRGPYSKNIDLSKLTQGFYQLEISTSNKQIYYSKFIKD